MPHDPYKALYIHIPFCVQRCNYCDFYTHARDFNSVEIDEYIEKVILEIRKASKDGKFADISTIYIGGGTPSYIGSKRLSSLLYTISLSINLEQISEFSIEANPESLNINIIKDIWSMGVNRLSIGVQSFDDNILKLLGRAHDSKDAENAINIAKSRFENISIDLMCGIPGQSTDSFISSLQKAISLDIPHISIYPLSIEYHTNFYKWKVEGRIDDIDDDIQAEHMEIAHNMLSDKGYVHYEVASYAKPNFECEHNLSYWKSMPYIGIGHSATTMTQNDQIRMRMTDNNIDDDLNRKQMIAEDLMLAMRTKYGVSSDLYNKALNCLPNVEKEFKKLQKLSLIKKENNSFVPTYKGWLCGNDLYSRLMDLA